MAAKAPASGSPSPRGSWMLTAGAIDAVSPVAGGRGTRVTLKFPREGASRMTGKPRVLVVDDEPAILRFLKPALEANDYEVTSAGTLAEALKRIAKEPPDVVVLDLGLPDGDGKDVIRAGAAVVAGADHRAVGARARGRKDRSARPRRRRFRQQAIRRRRADGAPARGAAPSPPDRKARRPSSASARWRSTLSAAARRAPASK